MLKHKNKETIVELYYKKEVDNLNLSTCVSEQHTVITSVSDLYNSTKEGNIFKRLISYITLPFKLNKQLNKHQEYFYTYKLNKFKIMNEEQLLVSLDYINDYENKKVSPVLYMDYIQTITGVNVCKSCGATNNRLHNDFQRRVFNTMKNEYSYLAKPIVLISGKYNSAHYITTIPYYTYTHLHNLLIKMNKDLSNYTRRGIKQAVVELTQDVATLEAYIADRKNSSLLDHSEDLTVPVSPSKEVKDTTIEEIKIVPKKAIKESVGGTVEPAEIKLGTPVVSEKGEVVKATKVVTNAPVFILNGKEFKSTDNPTYDKLITMRDEGMHLRKAANQLGIEYKGLTKLLKEYQESK